jgi:hypothetical protein
MLSGVRQIANWRFGCDADIIYKQDYCARRSLADGRWLSAFGPQRLLLRWGFALVETGNLGSRQQPRKNQVRVI